MRSLVRGAVVAGLLATGVGPAAAAAAPPGAVPGVVGALAAAADATPSQIRVDLSADILGPKSGDVVNYTLRVQNSSTTDYPHMNVFQLLPTGFHVTESTPKAAVRTGGPEWTANVPAGATAVFSVTATAGTVAEVEHSKAAARQRSNNPGTAATEGAANAKTPPATSTFTTVACARVAAVGPALACGSAKQTLSDSPDGADGGSKWRPSLLGLGFAAVLFAGLRGYLRKRSARRARSE